MPTPPRLPGHAGRIIGILTAVSAMTLAACSSVPSDGGSARGSQAKQTYRTKLDGWGPQSPPAGFPKFVDHSVGQEEISMQAMGLVGVPYRWGGNTPAAGFDCSGLVRYVVDHAARLDLPRTTADMSREGVSISPSEVAPGDLIFFNTSGRAHSHVGIYVGDYRFVNAPSTGGTVRIDYVTNPYWAKRFDGIRRIAGRNTAPILDTPVVVPAPARTEYASIAPAPGAAPSPFVTTMTPVGAAGTDAPVAPRPTVTSGAAVPAVISPPAPGAAQALPAMATSPTSPSQAADPIAAIARANSNAPVALRTPAAQPLASQAERSVTGASSADGARREVRTAQAVPVTPGDDDPIARIISRGY